MILDPLDIPDKLLEAQEQGRLVVFAGAGVSRGSPSDLPDFNGLATQVAKGTTFETELSKHEQRLDRYFGEMARGKVDIQHLVRQKIGSPVSKPTDLHRWILELFPDPKNIRIVTTNFDTHFNTLIADQKLNCDQYFAPALPLGHKFRGLVHLHGSLLREDPLVLSDEDFGRAYMIEGWARDFLRGMFDTYTTLFIGYSHTDPPVEYLARGMSAIHVAPRYALVSKGEEGLWNSLQVKPITFEKPGGDGDFSELGRGLQSWAKFTKLQPTDVGQRVNDLVLSQTEPALSESSFLARCLGRKEACHFFTNVANGWRWVKWADDQGLLKPLFDPASIDPEGTQVHLASWLARMLISEPSDHGLLLVAHYNQKFCLQLWLSLCHHLWTGDKVDFKTTKVQQWVLLVVTSCPANQKNHLGHFLAKAAHAAPETLGLILFRFLTNVQVGVSSGFAIDFSATPDLIKTLPQAEFNLLLTGSNYHLEDAWSHAFKPLIPTLGQHYLRLLVERIREMHAVLQVLDKADDRYDPWSMRTSIGERNRYPSEYNGSMLVDFLLDLVEELFQKHGGLPVSLIEEWLQDKCPTLVRIGLLSLLLSKSHSANQKFRLLIDRGFIYPAVLNANYEVNQLLAAVYPDLASTEKEELWTIIAGGPQYAPALDVKADDWKEYCQRQIDRLTGNLATKFKDCPQANIALGNLKVRAPEFAKPEMEDWVAPNGGVIDMAQSPKSVSDLLSQSVESQIEFLLTYQGEPRPSGVTRAGLVGKVGDACAQNSEWAISLFKELVNRQEWTSDLWEGAFWRLKLAALQPNDLIWFLGIWEVHFAASPRFHGLTFFLFNGVEFTEPKAPPIAILDQMIRISVLIWQQLKKSEPSQTKDLAKTEWTSRAINHPAGHIVEFWLKGWSHLRAKSKDAPVGWPEWLQAPLADMIEGGSYAAQLGRAILGNQMPFLHAIDPAWVREKLFPKFDFTLAGEEAFILWEPHLKYGRLSRDLIIEMMPLYRQSFTRFQHDIENDLVLGLYRHVSVIIFSCLVDVDQDGWLKEFLLGLSEEQRGSWANQMEFVLRDYPSDRKQVIWDRWLKDYWQGRLHGKPCILTEKEAGELLECALSLEPVFPAAVDLVLQGPPVKNRIGTILYHLEQEPSNLIQLHPNAVLRLLKWLFHNCREDWYPSDEVEKVIMLLPKKRAFVSDLVSICDQLAKFGFAKSIELKAKIQKHFIED